MSDNITIKNIKPKIQYIGDGETTTYTFPFSIFKNNNITIYFGDTIQNNGYSVTIDEENGGGYITFDTAPAQDVLITIVRKMTIERTSDFQVGGAIRAEELNYELDYQTACSQQLADDLSRSMILPPYIVGDDIDFTMPLPSPGKTIVWSEDGKKLENSIIEVNKITSELAEYKNTASTKAQIAVESATQAEAMQQQCAEILEGIQPENLLKKNLSNNTFLSNVILQAPNGVASLSENTISIQEGLKLLIPNGRTADGTFNSIEYTLSSTISSEVSTENINNEEAPIIGYFWIKTDGTIGTILNFFVMDKAPISNKTTEELYYNTKENKYYHYETESQSWVEMPNIMVIGKYTSANGAITSIDPKTPIELKSFNEIGDLYAHRACENQNGEDTDLNNYKEPGIYIFSNSGTIYNAPSMTNGVLMVFGNRNLTKQIFFRWGVIGVNDNDTCTRTYWASNNTWSVWSFILD